MRSVLYVVLIFLWKAVFLESWLKLMWAWSKIQTGRHQNKICSATFSVIPNVTLHQNLSDTLRLETCRQEQHGLPQCIHCMHFVQRTHSSIIKAIFPKNIIKVLKSQWTVLHVLCNVYRRRVMMMWVLRHRRKHSRTQSCCSLQHHWHSHPLCLPQATL
jgi:hypothetical protein